jgi:hypothetical protein
MYFNKSPSDQPGQGHIILSFIQINCVCLKKKQQHKLLNLFRLDFLVRFIRVFI